MVLEKIKKIMFINIGFNTILKTSNFVKAFCKLGPVCPEGYVWLPPTRACVSLKNTKSSDTSATILRDHHSGMFKQNTLINYLSYLTNFDSIVKKEN